MRLSSAAAPRARTAVAIIAMALLLMSFAALAILHNRPQGNGIAGANPPNPGCPSLSGRVASSLVGASFSVSSSTATYHFDSLINLSPTNGVPGLIEYCVFVASDPTAVTAVAVGSDSTPFQASKIVSGDFSFSRGNGNPSNLPLDGTTGTVMGTATWSGAVPSSQTILLHINDAAECAKLYPSADAVATCWVLPDGSAPTPTATPTAPTATATATATTTDPTPTNTPILLPPAPTPTGTPSNGK